MDSDGFVFSCCVFFVAFHYLTVTFIEKLNVNHFLFNNSDQACLNVKYQVCVPAMKSKLDIRYIFISLLKNLLLSYKLQANENRFRTQYTHSVTLS